MRPFTLNTLYGFLNAVRGGAVPEGDARFRELVRVSLDLGFISRGDDGYVITERGLEFMRAFESGDSAVLHRLFMEGLEAYRRIYELFVRGVTRPGDIARLTGYNAVVTDLVLRLISEVEGLGGGNADSLYARFEEVLLRKYVELSRRRWSRYVPINQLLSEVRSEFYVPNRLVGRLLEEFVRRWGSKVVLAGAPSAKDSVTIHGKKYTYIMIDVGGVVR